MRENVSPIVCLFSCVRWVHAESRRELFVSRGCVLSYLRYCFSCKYGGRGWCRSNSLPGSNPRLDLDRCRRLSRQFWAESGSSGDISGSRKGVKCLSSISNRKFRDQIHPRFEARYYFSVYEWRTMKLEEGNRLLLHHFWRCARENILIVDRNFNIVKEDLFLYP